MGFWAMAIHALHGKPAPIGALFSQINKAVKYILQVLAIWIPLGAVFGAIGAAVFFISVGSIDLDMPLEDAFEAAAPGLGVFFLLSIPIYVYIFLGILFAQLELTFNDGAGPIEAVVYSWRIARKRRWLVLGATIISSLIAMGSILLCGVGFLFGGPLAALILASKSAKCDSIVRWDSLPISSMAGSITPSRRRAASESSLLAIRSAVALSVVRALLLWRFPLWSYHWM